MAIYYLDIDDEITSAAARIRGSADAHIALVMPAGSRVATSRINFKLLEREAKQRNKRLAIVAPDASVRSLAQSAGLDGVVASAREIAAIRRACGPQFLIVTPGIRPVTAASNDQARIATPGAAIEAGADFLVVGRPITEAADPAAAADAIAAEMEKAMSARMGVS